MKKKKRLNKRIRIGNTVWIKDKEVPYSGPGMITNIYHMGGRIKLKVKLPICPYKSKYLQNINWIVTDFRNVKYIIK